MIKKKVKRIIEKKPGTEKKVIKGFGWFLIISGILTMIIAVPTALGMLSADNLGGGIIMWLGFMLFWFGLILRYVGRRLSQEVVIEEVIEEQEEGEEQDKAK